MFVDERNVSRDKSSDSFAEAMRQHWNLSFVDPCVEEKYLRFRHEASGLSFVIAVSFLMLVANVVSPNVEMEAEQFRTNPTDRFFGDNSSWQKSAPKIQFARNLMYALASGCVVMITILVAMKWRKIPLSGFQHEWIWSWPIACVLLFHLTADARRDVYCKCGVSSILTHTPTNPPPLECPDFIDPFIFLTFYVVILMPNRMPRVVLLVLPITGLLFVVRAAFELPLLYSSDLFWIPFVYLGVLSLATVIEYLSRLQFRDHEFLGHKERELATAKESVHELLRSMLPRQVLSRMMSGEVVEDHGVATVLFTDVVGFTKWCDDKHPQQVVQMLNIMYCKFDEGLDRYIVEKIKTIGDAYWAVSGMPVPNGHEHAQRMCGFSQHVLEMVESMSFDYDGVQVRVGVHTGEVIGGVIDAERATYDLFGTTNDIAGHMEQSAQPMEVLISESTLAALRESPDLRATDYHVGKQQSIDLGPPMADGESVLHAYALQSFRWEPPSPANCSLGELSDDGAFAFLIDQLPQHHQQASRADPIESETHSLQSERHVSPSSSKDRHEEESTQYRSSNKVHLNFDDCNVEDRFVVFLHARFRNKFRLASALFFVLCALLFLTTIGESVEHPPHLYVGLTAMTLMQVVFIHAPSNVLHPYAGLVVFYVECAGLLLVMAFAHPRSVVGVDLHYLLACYVISTTALGYVGIPYLYTAIMHFVFLYVPQTAVHVVHKPIHVIDGFCVPLYFFLWLITARRDELDLRKQFMNEELACAALQSAAKEHRRVNQLLKKMVPIFVVEELSEWFCGPRVEIIAATHSDVGILFLRLPQFRHKAETGVAFVKALGTYAIQTERLMGNHPHCTKMKMVGDITMIASNINGYVPSSDDDRGCNPLMQVASGNGDASPAHRDLIVLMAELARVVQDCLDTPVSAGIHCGPCTAGVLGSDRLFYDVFGDTVNTASRVMSCGGVGMWVSSRFAEQLDVPLCFSHGESPDQTEMLNIGEAMTKEVKGKGFLDILQVHRSDIGIEEL